MTFGLDQCPGCGSDNVTQSYHRKDGAGLPPVTDIETMLACNDCGRNQRGEHGD